LQTEIDSYLASIITTSLDHLASSDSILVGNFELRSTNEELFNAIATQLETSLIPRLPIRFSSSLQHFLTTTSTILGESRNLRPAEQSPQRPNEFIAEFKKDLITAIQSVLIAIQNLKKLSQTREEEEKKRALEKKNEDQTDKTAQIDESTKPSDAATALGEAAEANQIEFDEFDDDNVVKDSHTFGLEWTASMSSQTFVANLSALNSRIVRLE